MLSVQLWRPQLSCGALSSALELSAHRRCAAPTVDSRLETLPLPSTPPSGIPHAARDEPRLSLVDCFVSLRLRLKRVCTKMEFSCCKKPYSIRYKLLHRTVTNQSTKHLLSGIAKCYVNLRQFIM